MKIFLGGKVSVGKGCKTACEACPLSYPVLHPKVLDILNNHTENPTQKISPENTSYKPCS